MTFVGAGGGVGAVGASLPQATSDRHTASTKQNCFMGAYPQVHRTAEQAGMRPTENRSVIRALLTRARHGRTAVAFGVLWCPLSPAGIQLSAGKAEVLPMILPVLRWHLSCGTNRENIEQLR